MTHDRVMLLIDADNVSLDVIEQAVPWVHQHFGGPHVRRAYCTAESAVKHQAAFKRLGIRPMVNLAAGKNSTDIALAVDAIDLATSERPEVVVIASSDSDFAPLVSRLREKGCRVIGVGQQGKTGDETIGVYDDYEVLSHRKAERATPVKAAAKKAAAPKKVAAKKAPAPAKSLAAVVVAPDLPDKALAILQALPRLAVGETLDLNTVASRLRELGLLSKNASSTKLLQQFPALFELTPTAQPNKVKTRVRVALD